MVDEVQTVDLAGRLQTLAKRGMQVNVLLLRIDAFMQWYFDEQYAYDTAKYATEREAFEAFFEDKLKLVIELCEAEVRAQRLHVPGSTAGQLMVPGTEVL